MHRHAEAAGAVFRTGKALSALPMEDKWYVSIGTDMENAHAVVLAAGVARRKKFPGEEALLGRGVSYCATCDGMLYRGKPVAVLGYSATARQEAAFLESIGCQVTYFHAPKHCAIRGGAAVEEVTCDGVTLAVSGVFLLRPTQAPTVLVPRPCCGERLRTGGQTDGNEPPRRLCRRRLYGRPLTGIQGGGRGPDRRTERRRLGGRAAAPGIGRTLNIPGCEKIVTAGGIRCSPPCS